MEARTTFFILLSCSFICHHRHFEFLITISAYTWSAWTKICIHALGKLDTHSRGIPRKLAYSQFECSCIIPSIRIIWPSTALLHLVFHYELRFMVFSSKHACTSRFIGFLTSFSNIFTAICICSISLVDLLL